MKLLNGWKEIAFYLGRGVRTAQRWEQQSGCPVRRRKGAPRSAVFAFAEELDGWVARTPTRDANVIAELHAKIARLEAENRSLRQQLLKATASQQHTHSAGSVTPIQVAPKRDSQRWGNAAT